MSARPAFRVGSRIVSGVTSDLVARTDTMLGVAEAALQGAERSREIADRSERYGRIEAMILTGVVILVAVAVAISLYFGQKGSDRDTLARHQDCVATALVDYAAASGDAFAMPNPQAAIENAAVQLRTDVHAC